MAELKLFVPEGTISPKNTRSDFEKLNFEHDKVLNEDLVLKRKLETSGTNFLIQ